MQTRGEFFTIDSRIWAQVTACGMNEAVAYLVLACGTGRDNAKTSWSVKALKSYAGISWERAKAAVERLINAEYIRFGGGHTKDRPRYELVPFYEWRPIDLAKKLLSLNYDEREITNAIRTGIQPSGNRKRKLADRLVCQGLLSRTATGKYALPEPIADDPTEHLLWLPNTIVTGTKSGEESPVRRLRSAGDIWTLRLFVDLYHEHNLRDDGGINPRVIRESFDRLQVGQQGAYTVWGFKAKTSMFWWTGPFVAHQNRQKAKDSDDHPVWDSVRQLQRLGLLTFVPHIFENGSEQAEPIHSYGVGNCGEAVELQIGAAANAAARAMCLQDKLRISDEEGYRHYCPVIQSKPDVQMIGIARLLYRPHTRRTAAWYSELHQSAGDWIEKYQELTTKARKANTGLPTKYAC